MSLSLKIQSLSKKYASSLPLVLSNFNLEVNAGEIVALLGESGSGKTTLLRLISGLEYPTSGEIIVHGKLVASDSTFLSPEKRQVGLVFQDYALFPHMTVLKNVAYGTQGNKHNKKNISTEMLNLVGLGKFGSRFPHEISGGQQQRVALARALATQPKLLLLDEPFSNLDEGLKAKVRADLRGIIKKTGITAIFVTHDTQDAMAVADKIALLNQGKLAQYDSPQMLYQQPASEFVAKYFGKVNWFCKKEIEDIEFSDYSNTETISAKEKIGFRPHQFQLANNEEVGMSLLVKSVSYYGNESEVVGELNQQDLIVRLRGSLSFSVGDSIKVKPVGKPIIVHNS